ncbi:hypothetical protein VTH82DRAFT_5254 [Thermothelomyces myriococcoides]
MISWALRRNSDSARDATASDDTTQIEAPDTPAPVFAVRALKTALFGTPAPRDRRPASKSGNDNTATKNGGSTAATADKSPAKPPGILLTPGTDNCPGKFPSPWVDRNGGEAQPRPKTKLQQAMERSRKGSTKENAKTDVKDFAAPSKEPEDVWEEVDDDDDEEEEEEEGRGGGGGCRG